MKLKEKNKILMNLANHTEKSVLMPENPVTLDNPDGIYLYRGRIPSVYKLISNLKKIIWQYV